MPHSVEAAVASSVGSTISAGFAAPPARARAIIVVGKAARSTCSPPETESSRSRPPVRMNARHFPHRRHPAGVAAPPAPSMFADRFRLTSPSAASSPAQKAEQARAAFPSPAPASAAPLSRRTPSSPPKTHTRPPASSAARRPPAAGKHALRGVRPPRRRRVKKPRQHQRAENAVHAITPSKV